MHSYVSKEAYGKMGGFWKEKLFRNVVRDEVADSFYGACGMLVRILV